MVKISLMMCKFTRIAIANVNVSFLDENFVCVRITMLNGFVSGIVPDDGLPTGPAYLASFHA